MARPKKGKAPLHQAIIEAIDTQCADGEPFAPGDLEIPPAYAPQSAQVSSALADRMRHGVPDTWDPRWYQVSRVTRGLYRYTPADRDIDVTLSAGANYALVWSPGASDTSLTTKETTEGPPQSVDLNQVEHASDAVGQDLLAAREALLLAAGVAESEIAVHYATIGRERWKAARARLDLLIGASVELG